MKRKTCFCLLLILLGTIPAVQAGTKEELVRLQNDIHALQTQLHTLEKNFSEQTDRLKSLVEQLNDQVGKSALVLDRIANTLENQTSGTKSTDQNLIQELRNLSTKIDDTAMRISALAQQFSEFKMQSKAITPGINPDSGSQLSPDDIYNQAFNDLVQGNLDLAITGFTAYINNFPAGDKVPAAQYNIGAAYYNQNKLPQAIAAFTRVVNDYPNSDKIASSLFKRGKAELAMQEKDNAIADFRAIIEKHPASSEAAQAKAELVNLNVSITAPAPRDSRRKQR